MLPADRRPVVRLHPQGWEAARKRAIDRLIKGPVAHVRSLAEIADEESDSFVKLDGDHCIVASVIHLTRFISLPPRGAFSDAFAEANDLERLARAATSKASVSVRPRRSRRSTPRSSRCEPSARR